MKLDIVTIVVLAAVFIATIRAENTIYKACPPNFEYAEGVNQCYGYGIAAGMAWFDARADCQSQDADLAVIKDSDTSETIQNLMAPFKSRFWLGLREMTKGPNPEFVWVDGSPLTYDEWWTGEPNNDHLNGFDCVECYPYEYDTAVGCFWNDKQCFDTHPYICEMSLDVYPACPSGFVSYAERKKCVKASHEENETWDSARNSCQRLGGDLVVITDDAYNTFIKEELIYHNDYWIGLRYNNTNSYEFEWVNGKSLGYYNGWNPGQSDNHTDGAIAFDADRCVMLEWWTGLRIINWIDADCNLGKGFICELDYNEPLTCSDADWILNTRNGKCYKIESDRRTFDVSRARCQQNEGDLAIITDSDTKEFFIELSKHIPHSIYFWIGLVTSNGSCTHEWLDGSCLGEEEVIESIDSGYERLCVAFLFQLQTYLTTRCSTPAPSICERNASKGYYPVVECPTGYTTDIMKPDWRISCLMVKTNRKTWFAAVDDCSAVGGELVVIEELEHVYDLLMMNTGGAISSDDDIWVGRNSCRIYRTNVSEERDCDDEYMYVCLHRGNIRSAVINLKNVTGLISEHDSVFPDSKNHNTMFVSDVCMAELYTLYNWTSASSSVSMTIEMNFIYVVMDGKQECCVLNLVNLNSMQLQTTEILCVCPQVQNTTIEIQATREAVSILRDITAPKNDTVRPKNLCPCRCDSMKIDFNPTPQVLAEIIFKIQKELKVDAEQLSSKRNKKISAADKRVESQAMGYIGVILVLIPVCLMVALDVSKRFKTKPKH